MLMRCAEGSNCFSEFSNFSVEILLTSPCVWGVLTPAIEGGAALIIWSANCTSFAMDFPSANDAITMRKPLKEHFPQKCAISITSVSSK